MDGYKNQLLNQLKPRQSKMLSRIFKTLKRVRTTLKTVLLLLLTLIVALLISIKLAPNFELYATNILSNPSFTGGTTGWTLTNMTYDSTTYQDSAGSVTATAGRKANVSGTAVHTSYTSINSYDIVTLSGYWMFTTAGNGNGDLYIEIEEQSNSGTWTQIWASGNQTASTTWTAISSVNVSSYFSTGSYRMRLRAELYGGAATGSDANAWFDNMNLDVVTPTITVGTTGTQTSEIQSGTSNAYIGGAFTFVRNVTSTSVTSITISETGTIADSNISGLILYYKQEATCSTSIPGDATQFNSTPGSFTSGSSTVTGTMTVGTSQVCVYVEVDIGSGAQVDDTVAIQITDPSSDVTASVGEVSPATAVAISGTTTITSAGVLSVDIVDGTDQSVTSPSVAFNASPFTWTDTQTTATLGTSSEKIKVSNYTGTAAWTLSIAATDGVSALWDKGTETYDYNGTQSEGRLYVDPTTATITPGGSCSNTGLTLQSASYFVSGSIDSINLVVASGSAETSCDWYITGVSLTQDIPGRQAPGAYSLEMTLTVI